ncbi:hypothetical protein C7408_103259 [Paraburkholderia caballeronis]|uniref:Uncharacterized protein n=1 Tax=Paraburkholderia caballeronis TaxID=416943 RepID=A0A1H7HWN7_9BURK|nr:hypothetical protein C7403_101256 [Paraburkholderia caballeronis]PXX04662.1 hypothetical protein C7407_101256 [Paraburkholderia caballeronis]RAK05723.1 hypothetical protein C7409_101256 [Paraburkholderia caballeronis]TDV18502.1 hypothetical protein C7408_103259 [Paraburkholderia caballeronis]TDV19960.1 hypothetical protein C7406_103182 [Paraburkholderia caballeronis]
MTDRTPLPHNACARRALASRAPYRARNEGL